VNATPSQAVEIVDLQSLGLDRIATVGNAMLRIGATATLEQLMEAAAAPAVVRDAARREQPSTLRAQATVGGTIAIADRESELLAALLAHDAVVSLVDRDGVTELALEALLTSLPLPHARLIASVTIATDGRSAAARTGRTRADRPIVAVVGRAAAGGEPCLAACGVAATPVLLGALEELEPPADFRGSAEYRRALVETLAARVLERIS
jgi:CO/xanthine dehydrogenase FAD-binding subunit